MVAELLLKEGVWKEGKRGITFMRIKSCLLLPQKQIVGLRGI